MIEVKTEDGITKVKVEGGERLIWCELTALIADVYNESKKIHPGSERELIKSLKFMFDDPNSIIYNSPDFYVQKEAKK